MKLIQCHFAQLVLIYSFITDSPVWLGFQTSWLPFREKKNNTRKSLNASHCFLLSMEVINLFGIRCFRPKFAVKLPHVLQLSKNQQMLLV